MLWSHSAEVKITKMAKGGSLVCFRGSGRRFCFSQGSDVLSMFWKSLVQVFEQMNKKWTLRVLKNYPL